MELRPYQENAVAATFAYWGKKPGAPCLEMPTGAGKSIVLAEIIRRAISLKPDLQVIVATHVGELVAQNHAELLGIWPEADAGICSAKFGRKEIKQITFGTIQTLHRMDLAPDLVIIDEAHLVSNNKSTMYRRFLDECLARNPALKIVGLSATPYRLDNGLLTQGDNALFSDIITGKSLGCDIATLIEKGYLAPLVTPDEPLSQFDLAGIGKRGGEYIGAQLAQAIAKQDKKTEQCVQELVRYLPSRFSAIVFSSSIDHAEKIAELLGALNVPAVAVTSKTDDRDRERALADFKAGRYKVIVSMNILTTGFNHPGVDVLAMMRPTESTSLYVQMVGRGTRTAPGKTDCLVLDFGGNIDRHGPVDQIKISSVIKKDGNGEAPVKECPNCMMLINLAARRCEYCGHQFPAPQPSISPGASTSSILGPNNRQVITPSKVTFVKHQKPGKPDSIKVTYWKGMKILANDWLTIYHPGYAGEKAAGKYLALTGAAAPDDIDAALELARREYKPRPILVDKSGKYPLVVG